MVADSSGRSSEVDSVKCVDQTSRRSSVGQRSAQRGKRRYIWSLDTSYQFSVRGKTSFSPLLWQFAFSFHLSPLAFVAFVPITHGQQRQRFWPIIAKANQPSKACGIFHMILVVIELGSNDWRGF